MIEPTQEIVDKICERLCSGESLRSICKDEALPCASTVFKWLIRGEDDIRDRKESPYARFVEQYVRARETQADVMMDEILDIADDGHNDWMLREFGENEALVVNGEALQRSKLRVEARFRMAARLRPKKYGEKMDLTTNGKDIKGTIVVATQSDKELLESI